MRKIGKYILMDRQILQYLTEDHDLSNRLAKELEIEIDPGESAGAFLRDTCQRLLDEQRISVAEGHLARIRDEIKQRSQQEDTP